MPLNPNIALAFRPTQMSGLDLGDMAANAQQALQAVQAGQQFRNQNALRDILSRPGAVNAVGNLSPEAMGQVMGVDPALGIKLKQNELVTQQNLMRQQVMQSDLFAKKMDNIYELYTPVLTAFEEAGATLPPDQAMRRGQEALDAANERAKQSGLYSPAELQNMPTQFDPLKLRQMVSGSRNYQDWQRGRLAMRNADRADAREARREALEGQGTPTPMQWTDEDGQPQHGMLVYNKNDKQWYTVGDNPQRVQNPKQYKEPAPGSAAETLTLIEQDLADDPEWKDKKPGARRQEAMRQMQVVQGRMTTPEQQDQLAKEIASYRIAPMSSFAMASPRGQAVMAKVMQYNPDYQGQRYGQIGQVMNAFGKGPEGRTVRAMNVAIQHLDVMDEAGKALKNGDMQTFNTIGNRIAQEFGYEAPTTYDALRRIVGTEIEKAVAGGVGALADREDLMKALSRANSPEQMEGVINGFKNLMAGQLKGLKTQYEAGTGFKDDSPFAFKSMVDGPAWTLLGRVGGEKAASASQSQAGGKTWPAPPQGAIDELKRSPGAAAQFDAIFGPGAADKVLGGAKAGGQQEQPKQQTQAVPQAQPSAYREGMTATNPQTGEKIVFRNGQWVPLKAAAPSAPTSE
jgi:hypothetical protein